MAGYDPKAKRAHSPAAGDKAPVDDLLGAPADEPTPAEPAPAAAAAPAQAPAPPPEPVRPAEPMAPVSTPPRPAASVATPGSGPAPKVLAIVAAVVAVLAIWRWRRR